MFVVHLQSKADSIIINRFNIGFPLTTRLEFDLKKEYLDRFDQVKHSPQVDYYNELVSKGFMFAGPINAVLADTDLNIKNTCWFDQLPLPQTAKDSILVFAGNLKELARSTDFDSFYAGNRDIYDRIIDEQESKISVHQIVSSIEDFFGWELLQGYEVVLAPMMWPGGISLATNDKCENEDNPVRIVIGPKRVKDGLPDFGTAEEYKTVVLHEFIHPFVYHYTTSHRNLHRNLLDKNSHLLDRQAEIYQQNGINDWFSAVNELITRTVEVIINSNGDREKALALIDKQKELGFPYIDRLYEAFSTYYLPYREEKSLEQVFPDILSAFDEDIVENCPVLLLKSI